MNNFEQLKAAAMQRRDLDHEKISREFHYALMTIRALERQFHTPKPHKSRIFKERAFRPADPYSPYRLMTTIQAAAAVLSEGKPLTLVEITIEIMDRGHRSHDQPRAVLKCLRSSILYHSNRFWQDAEGRWYVASL